MTSQEIQFSSKFSDHIFTKNFIALALINLLIMMAYYLLFVISGPYALDHFQVSPSTAGLVAGMMVLGCLVGRFVTGHFIAKTGCRRVLFIGIGIYTLSMACYFVAHTLPLFMLVRFVSGVGVGCIGTATGTIIACIVPPEKRGLGISYFSLSSILALALGPFLGLALRQALSYESMFLICTLTGLGSLLVAFTLPHIALALTQEQGQTQGGEAPACNPHDFKMENASNPHSSNLHSTSQHGISQQAGAQSYLKIGFKDTQTAGQQANQEAGQEAGQEANQPAGQHANQPAGQQAGQHAGQQAGQHAGQQAGQHAGQQAGPFSPSKSSLFKLSNYIDYCVLPFSTVVLLTGVCYSTVQAFISSFASQNNLVGAASFFFLVYAVVVLLSRPFTGRVFDQRGENIIVYPALVLMGFGFLLLSQASSGWMMLLAGGLLGAGFGNFQSIAQALVLKMVPRYRFGQATSTFFIFLDLGIGLGPYLFGFIVPFVGYSGVYLLSAGVAFVAIPFYVLMHGKASMQRI